MVCSSGKMVYQSRSVAKRAAKTIKRAPTLWERNMKSRTLRPYRCQECGHYHLTSSVPRPPKC